MSQWPKWLRRQYGKLEICGSCPGYDTDFSLKNDHQHEIAKEIKFIKWKWIGHVLRRENDNITRMAFDWNPHGLSRRRGRPKTTWCNTIRHEAEQAGKSWNEIKALAGSRV